MGLSVALFAIGCSAPSPRPGTTQQVGVQYVVISPANSLITPGASITFTGSAIGPSDSSVKWSIEEGAFGGTITNAGAYTAPPADGVYHVRATSLLDPSKSATATVEVRSPTSSDPLSPQLITARSYHTATLLQNGRVLIAGGLSSPYGGVGGMVTAAATYDAASNSFQDAGTISRAFHSATLLPNGDVLLAGGQTGFDSQGKPVITASADLFKAGSGSLQPTRSMSLPRQGHLATLLPNGKVLIVGGDTGPLTNGTMTAEIYDPDSGSFAPIGNLAAQWSPATATLLKDGRVLITHDSSAELYDPATNSFRLIAGSPAVKFASTATLLADGKVLIAGGETYYDDPYAGPEEIYDPATDQFTSVGKLGIPRWGHTATLLNDGTVLIAGGATDANDNGTPFTEIYNPATDSFMPGPSMLRGRVGHTATLLPDGSVLLVGGEVDANPTEEILR